MMKIEKSGKEHNNNINVSPYVCVCVRVCMDDKILIQFNFKKSYML